MEAPSQLEQFLAGQQSEGEVVDTQSTFTIAKEEALRKIAEFQLPFENAWVVKVIQCAVAEAAAQPIRVDLTAKEARFFFVTNSITLEDLEAAYYDPEPSSNPALNHLIGALWAVGLRLKWAFQFSPAQQRESLIWDGEKLLRLDNKERHGCTYLSVSLLNSKGTLGWIKDRVAVAKKHAEILKTLGRWCFTSPVPLSVDGRRIDSLFNCPTHAPGNTTFPLVAGFLSGLQPQFSVPPGTFRKSSLLDNPMAHRSSLTSVFEDGNIVGLHKNAINLIERLAEVKKTGGAYLLSSHWEWQGSGKQRKLCKSAEYTTIYWIRDGAVVDEQRLDIATHCSAAIFLSADELTADMTSFHLADTPQRWARASSARKELSKELHCMESLEESLDDVVSGIKSQGRWCGGALFGLGILAMFGSPAHGIGLMIGGAVVGGGAASKAVASENALREAVHKLRESLEKHV